MAVVALVAEDADRSRGFDQRGKLVELLLGLHGLEVPCVDLLQSLVIAGAGREPAFFRRAEPAQMHIANAAFVEPRGKLALGKTRAARRRHGAHIDQQFHPGLFQLV
jgi:hypothetical protein